MTVQTNEWEPLKFQFPPKSPNQRASLTFCSTFNGNVNPASLSHTFTLLLLHSVPVMCVSCHTACNAVWVFSWSRMRAAAVSGQLQVAIAREEEQWNRRDLRVLFWDFFFGFISSFRSVLFLCTRNDTRHVIRPAANLPLPLLLPLLSLPLM